MSVKAYKNIFSLVMTNKRKSIVKTWGNLIIHRSLVLISFVLPLNGMAQESSIDKPKFFPKLFGLNKSVAISVMGCAVDNFDYGAVGLNATVYGIYVDFMGWPRKNAKNVKTTDWEELSVWAAHIGYQIPFHKYLDGSIRMTPMVGYYAKKEGVVIYDDKTATATTGHFDYGAALVFQNKDRNIGSYTFSLGCTRYAVWAGFGLEFQL